MIVGPVRFFLYGSAPPLRTSGATVGGWGEIRTHGTLAGSPVFKTGALNRSATHPIQIFNQLAIRVEAGKGRFPPDCRRNAMHDPGIRRGDKFELGDRLAKFIPGRRRGAYARASGDVYFVSRNGARGLST